MDFNGIRRLDLPLRPKVRYFRDERLKAKGIARPPACGAGLSHALSAGRTLSRPLSATVYGKYDMPSLRLYERR